MERNTFTCLCWYRETLTLAKVANHIVAKKRPEFNGVCVLDDESFKRKVFEQLSPSEVWGIGK
jgi:DNA polymerase V